MFYKGKCLLSAYFDGISTKKEGVCTKKCCRKWNVFYDGKLKKVSFNPVARKFEGDLKIKPQYLKVEGRQFRKF
jgi:putative protease